MASAVHRRALALLADEAPDMLALHAHLGAGARRGRARAALLPYDSPPIARTVLAAGSATGMGSLLVQHGFDSRLGDPDKERAAHVALWSGRDRDDLAGRAAGELTVTGNPGVDHLAGRPAAPRSARGPALVLVEYPSRLSAAVDQRIGARHVEVALRALAHAQPGVQAIVRPHPSELRPQVFAALGSGIEGVHVTVDTVTPIEALAQRCSCCVGALSTATLQAAVLGVPTVFLDLAGVPRPWPFDGAPDGFPRATGENELADLLRARRGAEPEVVEAAREALGVRNNAVEQVIELAAAVSAAARSA
jgi:hypothetical protein